MACVPPFDPLALVNKGLALLQLERRDEMLAVADTLTASRMQQHHRAAGYAMRGDLDSLAVTLHRAFAAEEYSAGEAAKDVAFRPYWGLPAFSSILKPFTDSKIVFPRLESYPMSPAELRIFDSLKPAGMANS